ncbi:MAG: hypothetical protein HZB59_09610 [Ignavibacteriales bacterium]|nr:hypothetical protein [Ignavibacteriales bacterium]
MKSFVSIFFSFIFALTMYAQNSMVKGRIIYISSGTVYTSLGRDAGVRDSTLITVLSGKDTIAVLKVFATSSKTSVCTILNKKRDLRVGDALIFIPSISETKSLSIDRLKETKAGSTPVIIQAESNGIDSVELRSPSWLQIHGSVGLQYQGTTSSGTNFKYSQSGGIINLNGKLTDVPICFDIYANLRHLSRYTLNPFSSEGIDQSRIYRFSLSFNDGTNIISIGRIAPPHSPGIGYIDGLLALRTFGDLTFGLAAGFEPGYTQRTFSSNIKKAAVFGSYSSNSMLQPFLNISYARTYYGSLLNRESLSGSFRIFPFERLSISTLCDIDLRMKSETEYILSPKPSIFNANVDYRFPSTVAIGAGLVMWRPSYSFTSIRTIPDSLLDLKIRTTPNLNINIWLPHGISIYNNYSPRLVSGQLGKEYLNYSSITFSNAFNSGFISQFSLSLNSAEYSKSKIYGLSVQKNIFNLFDASLRYHMNQNTILRTSDLFMYRSYSLDIFTSIFNSVTLWGSVEHFVGYQSKGYTFLAEIRKKF